MSPATKTWLRRGAIAAAALFLGTALLLPQWNPLAGRFVASPENMAWIANGWSELQNARLRINEQVMDTGEWPTRLDRLDIEPAGEIFELSLRRNELVGTLRATPRIDRSLHGLSVAYRWDPRQQLWSCAAGDPPIPARYLPLNCRAEEASVFETVRWLVVVLVLSVIALVGLGALLIWRHPLIAPIQRDPARLRRTPLVQLPRIDATLGWLRRRDATLAAAGVDAADWSDALRYPRMGGAAQSAALALRVGARSAPATGWELPGEVYEWTFSSEMPVSLERCLIWLPGAGLDGAQLVRLLRPLQSGVDVLLVLPPSAAAETALRGLCADRTNLFVCIAQEAQTAWLLARDALPVLLRTMARQLRLSRISPYQTRGGIARASSFFGRESLLSRVVQREPSNYLLIGGRQLGKTSLMKAIERRLREHPNIACVYVVLRDQRLLPRLAAQCGLPLDADLETIVASLQRQHGGKRLLLLIDEADPFFRADAARDYAELSAMRALSEEGRCHFLLAGFWDLYAAAALDYQSPLRNFGDVISVGGLEVEACRELATVPLAVLNLRFADAALVERIVEQSGRRANLVAILCQECLEALDRGGSVVEAADVERALASQAVLDALAGWGRLSHDELASRLDRIVVYRVAGQGGTRLADMVELLRPHADIDVETLRRSFSRLQLAYVLERDGEHFRFAVPLFARQFEATEIPVLLAEELRRLR
ncbi:MAG TPA: AAA family ATPase [Tahibacter sp.]|uniref:nSTAND1 domain-containing NTPase n=1 Tax=Tahibacter sp. TaxID=2056211 RepID=UPI002C9DDDAC|nr:AAA family ATPase [Tahibacter sp.]HSX61173.1 AAA family ATPase [Tahibacter sp.]